MARKTSSNRPRRGANVPEIKRATVGVLLAVLTVKRERDSTVWREVSGTAFAAGSQACSEIQGRGTALPDGPICQASQPQPASPFALQTRERIREP
jgi:hypothetical protein